MEVFSGLAGLVILVLDIYAILQVLGSPASGLTRLVWVLVILLLPVLGLLIWVLAGPRRAPVP